ncbi:PHP domain-containing protein, partial [Patescibacteria group bacterium]|nr:PHP domain-containing protein [Patescibacteria group bacterium]
KGIPEIVFELLDIPGIGPKTALTLAKMGVKSKDDLSARFKSGNLVKKGFSEKLAKKIEDVLKRKKVDTFEGRVLLPYADVQAQKVLEYLKKSPLIETADVLGSLRRMVATVGDLDFAVASKKASEAINHIAKMPGAAKVAEKGEKQITIISDSGLSMDFYVVEPDSYGALLQHFTGSKSHNIHLRTLAVKKGLSLSEYGVKDVAGCKIQETKTEEQFYKLLGMQTPPPEIREDTGEIEAAIEHNLPDLVELKDIKGDLHIHSDFISRPSHDMGVNNIKEIVSQAKKMGYVYVGISDHQPSQKGHTHDQAVKEVKRKKEAIEQINSSQKSVRVLNLLEVDILPNGSLGLPNEVLEILDFAIASVHSSFNMSKEKMTNRILTVLESPYVKVLGHPTGRLIGTRESYEVSWDKIFEFAAKNNKALEINSFPSRLDLRDDLVRQAKSFGVKFIINTDAHQISQMDNMKYGAAVARRGWCEPEDIVNAWDWTEFAKWFNIREK